MRDMVLIPTYNERENIADLIKQIFQVAQHMHVMVIDDNSPDGTALAVKELQKKYPNLLLKERPRKEGLGRAYLDTFRDVLRESDVRSIIMMDADFSHDPKYFSEMLRLLETHDVVIGARYIRGGGTEGWEWYRKILSRGGNWYFRFILGIPVHDCSGGFNAIRTDALKKIDFDTLGKFRGYAFMTALKFLLWKAGARIVEIPILFKNRTQGNSKLSGNIARESVVTPWRLLMTKK